MNSAFRHYRLPAFADMPTMEVKFINTNDRFNPNGSKSIGEIGIQPVPSAIKNAVANATGVRFYEMPLMPHVVLKGIQSKPKPAAKH